MCWAMRKAVWVVTEDGSCRPGARGWRAMPIVGYVATGLASDTVGTRRFATRGRTNASAPTQNGRLRVKLGGTPVEGVPNEENAFWPASWPASRHVRNDVPCIRPNQEGEFWHAESRRYRSGLHAEVFRRRQSEGCEAQRLSRQKERCPGLLCFCLYRWLNAADEKLPAEPAKAGSYRHPGPGCEHG